MLRTMAKIAPRLNIRLPRLLCQPPKMNRLLPCQNWLPSKPCCPLFLPYIYATVNPPHSICG